MREIKFRAFNKAERKMCRVVSIDFTGFITVRFPEFERESDDYNDQMLIEEFEPIMQYTGLKDKNGKEIYEGDILKLVLVDWSDVPEDIFTVSSEQFVEDVCYLKAIIANAIEVESQTDCIEVIGNIYENPELLEG